MYEPNEPLRAWPLVGKYRVEYSTVRQWCVCVCVCRVMCWSACVCELVSGKMRPKTYKWRRPGRKDGGAAGRSVGLSRTTSDGPIFFWNLPPWVDYSVESVAMASGRPPSGKLFCPKVSLFTLGLLLVTYSSWTFFCP